MAITYTITVKDELNDVKRLHHTLQACKSHDDEIIAVHLYRDLVELDHSDHLEIKEYLLDNVDTYCNYKQENNIAHLKNYTCSLATKDYIFLLDANEYMTTQTITLWKEVIKNEPDYDIFWTPRVNIDETMEREEAEVKYGLKINEQGWINWPDNQPKIIKNNKKIFWEIRDSSISIRGVEKSGSLASDVRLATINHKRNK